MAATPELWTVDASHGGGQLVRTAMAIAAWQGRPLHLTGIRATRSRPGLARQHAAAAQAMADATAAEITGAQLGSLALAFQPQDTVSRLDLDIHIGTAGSTMLVLQSLLPLLVRRGGSVRVHGGTDNPLAPPVDFYRSILLPALGDLGIELDLQLLRRGYFPKGGGEVVATAPGQATWQPIRRTTWGNPVHLRGVAYSSNLPLHVTERMRDAVVKGWKKARPLPTEMRPILREATIEIELRPAEPALSPGAGIVLWAEDEAGTRVAGSGLGERGKPAEKVGDEAVTMLLEDLAAAAPVDRHLGDQLAIWAALADGESVWRVAEVTDHLTSSLALLADGLGVEWSVDKGMVRVGPGR